MGLIFRYKAFFCCLLACSPSLSLLAQEGSQDRILRDYFPDNEARDQAVITARYAEAAHRFAYELISPSFFEEEGGSLAYSDTARAFLLHARRRVDSTLDHAPDTADKAKMLMKKAQEDLRKGAGFLKAYRNASPGNRRKTLAEKALNRTAEASVDAFHASMLLGKRDVEPKEGRPKMEEKNLYDLMKGVQEKQTPSYDRKVSRLEADRESFRTLKERYAQRLDRKRESLRNLKEKGKESEKRKRLKEEIELLSLKKKDATEQVKSIDRMLQDRLLEHIGVDSSDKGKNLFQVKRWGYYDDRPIPIGTEQPEGLMFRVQIGYYSKGNRPEEQLEGLYPIWGEKVSGHYIRYCVGRFRGYEEADKAKKYLRAEKGFEDAFIVAYKDGEKIPVVKAIKERDR